MKKNVLMLMLIGLMLTGCGNAAEDRNAEVISSEQVDVTAEEEQEASEQASTTEAEQEASGQEGTEEAAVVISPLEDETMENLTDAILAVSLEEGGSYVDDTGAMQMDLKIYTYDKYDMVDVAALKVGDTLVTYAGEMEINSLDRNDSGTVIINGGLEEGGLDLATDDAGFFYEIGFNDVKSWYEVGEATIRVSADFLGTDNADPDQGEVLIYPGDFLTDAVTNYYFTPYNTTIRVEGGQIVELTRIYTP